MGAIGGIVRNRIPKMGFKSKEKMSYQTCLGPWTSKMGKLNRKAGIFEKQEAAIPACGGHSKPVGIFLIPTVDTSTELF